MNVEKAVLGTVDYIIFAFMLLVSAGIGVYFRFSGGKQKTTEEYLLAGQNMSILPVAFSLMASFLSAVTMMGIPAEMYKFGIHLAYLNIGFIIGTVLSSYLTLPVFFNTHVSSAYEYLEKRFGKLARTMSSLIFILQMILYMSSVLYAPALALSAVTDLSVWMSVVSIGVVCTFYCTLGGMKAVLWTDCFQAILMFLGVFAVIIKGIVDMDGLGNVYRIAKDGGRLIFPGFGFDPIERYTFWNIIIQGTILSMSSFSSNQVQIQRQLTLKNVSRSRIAALTSIPMSGIFHLLCCLVGIVLYANYHNCDPMTAPNKPITSSDQLMPFYMVSAFKGYPGLPGLCICGLFSGSLSTVSSAVNSLTAVTMQDLVGPFFASRGISQKKMAFSAKVITLLYGSLCVALTFLVSMFGNLIQAAYTILGMLGGPVLAVFLLGMLTTRANEKGAVIGLLGSVCIAGWISFGAFSYEIPKKTLPVSIAECSISNMSSEFLSGNFSLNTNPSEVTMSSLLLQSSANISGSMIESPYEEPITELLYEDIWAVYRISYMWFAPIGFFSAVIIGYIASILINIITGKVDEPDEETLSPVLRYFMDKNSQDISKEKAEKPGSMELNGINGVCGQITFVKHKEKEMC